jgi:NAD(P)-dependent dehydrogenase (short-subunit alcohol dehydrogenase family)
LEIVRAGGKVYLAARSKERAEKAIETIKKETGKDSIEFLHLDLADLKQTKEAAAAFLRKGVALDVLVNNAGIMAPPFELSKDGIESQFATNHVGHFLFTREILPALFKTTKPRIVNLSSLYHKYAPPEGINFDTWTRYGQTKLANILFSRALHKRYVNKGLLVNSVHPGFVDTELTRGPVASYGVLFSPFIKLAKILFALSPQQGALTQLYVATSPDIESKSICNKYFVPIAMEEKTSIPLAESDELADKLWDFTEKLVNDKLKQ